MTDVKVVFIGAADQTCRAAAERIAVAPGNWDLVLADTQPEALDMLVKKRPSGRATAHTLNLHDAEELRALINDAALVVLGTGPYTRTSPPVIEACLQARVPYLDLNDNVESTQTALALDEAAKQAGTSIYVGCGAAPGMTNMLVLDAARGLDTVENIDMWWVVGDERPGIDRAALEHLLHITAGDCPTWKRGGLVHHESFVETARADMGGSLGDTLMYETAHPEAVTIPRLFPHAQRIRVLGRLDPTPFNGLARGLAFAVQEGRMNTKQAVDFLEDLLNNKLGSVKGWRAALGGMRGQIRRQETTTGEVLKFLSLSAIRRTFPYRGGLMATVYGTKDGKPTKSTRRTPIAESNSDVWRGMAAVSGASCAAFILLAVDQAGQRTGALAPEDWADPHTFYQALERVGVPRSEIVETD